MQRDVMSDRDERDRAELDKGPSTDLETQMAQQGGASHPEDQERPGAAPPGTLSPLVYDRVSVGMEAYGAEGDRLGSIGERSLDWFRIDTEVGVGGVMYLPYRYVEDVVRDRVVLNAPSGLLYDMHLTEPPTAEAA